jgi:hypothetical protein
MRYSKVCARIVFRSCPSTVSKLVRQRGWGTWAYRIRAFELPEKHARIRSSHAEILVEERVQIVLCLGLLHSVFEMKLFGRCAEVEVLAEVRVFGTGVDFGD